jgi:hypothetical protein
LTKQIADALQLKISKGLAENRISGTDNTIAYVIKEVWFDGFQEGRKHPLTLFENPKQGTEE